MNELSNKKTTEDLLAIIEKAASDKRISHNIKTVDVILLMQELTIYINARDHKIINQTLAGQLERNKDAR